MHKSEGVAHYNVISALMRLLGTNLHVIYRTLDSVTLHTVYRT